MKNHHNFVWLKIHSLLIFLAFISTGLLFLFLQPFFTKYRIELTKKLSINQHAVQYIYHDFDHDGYSEYLIIKHDLSSKQDGVKYYTSNDGLVDQWTCGETILFKSICFTDYDGDHHDEVYFFTKGNDSLFLYAFDPRYQNQFLIFRKFIAHAPHPNPNPRKIWDVDSPKAIFFDADGNGFKNMFIVLRSGFSLQPRGLIKFDIRSQKVVAHSPLGGMLLGKPFLYDLTGDTIPEIILNACSSPGNYNKNAPFSDQYPWFVVFDLNLHFLFKPVPFSYPFSDIQIRAWNSEGQKYLVVLYDYHGIFSFSPTLYLFSPAGKLLRQRKLPSKLRWAIFSLPTDVFRQIFLVNENGKVEELNRQLQPIKSHKIVYPISKLLLSCDLDDDGDLEYLGIGPKGYAIVEANFSETTSVGKLNYSSPMLYSIKYNGKDRPQLVAQTRHNLFFFKYKFNLLYKIRFLIGVLAAIIFYLFFSLILRLLQNRIYERKIKYELGQFLPKGLLALDERGKIRSLNGAFEHLLKLHRHLQPGMYYAHALEERKELVKFIDDLVHNLSLSQEALHINMNGSLLQIKTQGIVLRGLFNTPVGFLILLDPAQKKLLDERLRVWVQTLQKMAHDIKAPLSSIQLGLQTIQMKTNRLFAENNNLSTDFNLINSELQRVREMAKQFLRFTNLEKPNFGAVNLEALIQKSLQKFHHFLNEKLQIKVELDPTVKIIYADSLLLEMAFQTILENAIEALNAEGLILISANLIQIPEKEFKKFVEIEICDNGPGISDDALEKIFDPFYSTKFNGTGLGLSIAKNIIESHQGSISIASHEGFSTVVRILLPINQ